MLDRTESKGGYDYDAAISFAGEDRGLASNLAKQLRTSGMRIFFDEFEASILWGKDLYEYLAEIYSRRARFCIMIVSKHYVSKAWPSHERKNAQARALWNDGSEYILPLRLDDTEVPGLPNTIGFVDLRTVTVEEVVHFVLEKIRLAPGSDGLGQECNSSDSADLRELPRELRSLPRDISLIALRKKPAWELEFFLELLKFELGRSSHLRQNLRYGIPGVKFHQIESGDFFRWSSGFLRMSLKRIRAVDRMVNHGFNRLFDSGESPGDPLPILELAQGIGRIYQLTLESCLEVQSLHTEPELENLVDLTSRAQEDFLESIEQVHSKIEKVFLRWKALPEDQKGRLDGEVSISVGMPLADEIVRETKRVAKVLGYEQVM